MDIPETSTTIPAENFKRQFEQDPFSFEANMDKLRAYDSDGNNKLDKKEFSNYKTIDERIRKVMCYP
jgi:hypothetical protein